MSIEQIEMASVVTEKSYRRLADWVIALLVLVGACIALAALLVQPQSSEVGTTASASFSVDAAADSRSLNQPAMSTAATFTLPGVLDSRGLNTSAAPRDYSLTAVGHVRALNEAGTAAAFDMGGIYDARALNTSAAPRNSYMTAVGDLRALNEVGNGAAFDLAGIEDARALNTPASSLRFLAGPGR